MAADAIKNNFNAKMIEVEARPSRARVIVVSVVGAFVSFGLAKCCRLDYKLGAFWLVVVLACWTGVVSMWSP